MSMFKVNVIAREALRRNLDRPQRRNGKAKPRTLYEAMKDFGRSCAA